MTTSKQTTYLTVIRSSQFIILLSISVRNCSKQQYVSCNIFAKSQVHLYSAEVNTTHGVGACSIDDSLYVVDKPLQGDVFIVMVIHFLFYIMYYNKLDIPS